MFKPNIVKNAFFNIYFLLIYFKEYKDRVSALSPFDEQEEWAKIQEIMASFGTGIVRESVFVAELEKEFQSRLMTISCSQHSLANSSETSGVRTVEKWLQGLGMGDYAGLFMSNGFDDLNFLVSHFIFLNRLGANKSEYSYCQIKNSVWARYIKPMHLKWTIRCQR